jgi:hypothetical protein
MASHGRTGLADTPVKITLGGCDHRAFAASGAAAEVDEAARDGPGPAACGQNTDTEFPERRKNRAGPARASPARCCHASRRLMQVGGSFYPFIAFCPLHFADSREEP